MLSNAIDVIKSKEFNSLDYINRFNNTRVHNHETVSQHTHWVVLFAHLILEGLEDAGMFKNFKPELKWQVKYEVLQACIFHDFDESITGDILHTFKHNDFNGADVKKSITSYINHKLSKFDEGTVISNTLIKSLKLADDSKLIKFIVKMADWLACIKFEWAELQVGNVHFQQILTRSDIALNKLICEFISYLYRAQIIPLGELFNPIETYLNQYKDINDKLNKQNNG